ncbi:hypothetical protein DFH11DRAFT_1566302 [Phellopilus nigrolimitatus]|nr:hypothetical protein DFH11DRAFT_1566302 [Phellopilus nigrolimitatus]
MVTAANMPADEVYWVRPLLPTVLGDIAALLLLSIPDGDAAIASTAYGLVFPGTVHLAQLENALSRALQEYPHVAGCLNSTLGPKGSSWTIALVNKPVRLTVSCAPAHFDPAICGLFRMRSRVFIESLTFSDTSSPAEVPMDDDVIDVSDNVDSDYSLATLKLTYYPRTHESSLVLLWSGSLGGAQAAYGFLHTLHSVYLCESPVHIPNFEEFEKVEYNSYEKMQRQMRSSLNDCAETKLEEIDLRFNALQLQEIVSANARNKSNGEPNSQDSGALKSYLISLLACPASDVRPFFTWHDLTPLPFPSLSFMLPSPSLPPKKARFFFIPPISACSSTPLPRCEIWIWPAGADVPGGVRIHLKVRFGNQHGLSERVKEILKGELNKCESGLLKAKL